ncbi:nitrogenase iron-molybdenum cofactor biosynthesis protein NifN [Methanobrevibacter filiformis]|uniref:Nitrogenase iron-molybdenum cofactor biosynthesis protein NifN n=1 Tax=Methanobrevibacter filiformis TaxID=55758 RepID=A0A166DU94_9EURY|nr:nitrogenase iron-molybdenum cofactor biosynthesis protein NifN [Methanobrevibacter filiformis]KZX15958.1 nitrogenase molybdenum-iron protein beta chain [Methanobrevibacter filiformis]
MNDCNNPKSEENCDKKFAVVNPTRMCQPMGAVQAMMGVKGAMPLIHGSQGCATYMRFQLIRHFREPIEVASTSLSEKTVIYGGEPNLLKALKNISEKQNPEMICVMSSCLTDTIGDDIGGIIRKFEDANIGLDIPEMIPIPTPSYAGSHIEGYDKAILALVEHFGRISTSNNKINLIMGNMSPANNQEVKNLMNDLGAKAIILTDVSETLDGPLNESTLELHQEGTSLKEIEDTPNSIATISLSKHADSAGKYLKEHFNVESISGPLPVGIKNTDEFVMNVCDLIGVDVPKKVERDRGRLQDALVDAHAYNYRKKVAIYGDPDTVIAIAHMISEMGMIPKILCTGIKSERFIEDIKELSRDINFNPIILADKDIYDLEQTLNNHSVDLLIGNAYGASLANKFNIPLFRIGFPIFDRIGSQRITFVGYTGGIRFVDALTNMILDYYYDAEGYKLSKEELSFTPKSINNPINDSNDTINPVNPIDDEIANSY